MKKIIKKLNAYHLYTILFILLCVIIFFGFFKNGRSFVWMTDGFKQHYLFLEDFHRSIKEGFSSFSWSLGLGLDKIGQLSYYILGDPFAYISLLFPASALKYIYSILVILRMYCVGLSFIYYCNYHKKDKYATLIGALVYTFSGFILYAAIRHPFFTNTAIWLPLMFLGIDKILKEGKYKLFTIITAISAISNYYFFYMMTILTFIYAITKFFNEYRDKGIKTFWSKFIKTLLCYIIGVLSASILLLPTIYTFSNNSRGIDFGFTYYDFDYYANLITMNTKTPFWTKTYVAPIVLAILPIAILNFKKNKENRTYLINLAIQTIILLIPFLGSMMNGFSFQSNRWVFAYSFVLSYLLTLNIRKDLIYSPREFKTVKKYLVLYLVLWYFLSGSTGSFPALSIFIAFAFLIIMVARCIDYKVLKSEQQFIYVEDYKKQSSTKIKDRVKYVLLIFLCIDILFFSWQRIYRSGYSLEFLNYSSIDSRYDSLIKKLYHFNDAIDYIKSNDNSFYRIATNVYESNNESLRYRFNGLNTYLSVGNKYITALSRDLMILNNAKTNPLREFDSRTRITTLLGTKYYVASEKNKNYVPYGYKKVHDITDINYPQNTAQIYENENYLPIGVFYNNYILKQDYDKLTALEKEQLMLKATVVENKEDISNYNISTNNNIVNKLITKNIEYELINPYNVVEGNEIKINKLKAFNINIKDPSTTKNCELYLLINNLKFSKDSEHTITMKYNGLVKEQVIRDKVSSPYYVETPNIMFNLGYRDEHSGNIELSFSAKGIYTFDNIQLIAVPMDSYKEDIEKLKQSEFKISSYSDNSIVGNINNVESGILQISTSYSSGWKAYVDGIETNTINVNTGFIGIPLSQGNHKIEFTYSTPYLDIGIKLSIVGIILIIAVCAKDIISGRRKKACLKK